MNSTLSLFHGQPVIIPAVAELVHSEDLLFGEDPHSGPRFSFIHTSNFLVLANLLSLAAYVMSSPPEKGLEAKLGHRPPDGAQGHPHLPVECCHLGFSMILPKRVSMKVWSNTWQWGILSWPLPDRLAATMRWTVQMPTFATLTTSAWGNPVSRRVDTLIILISRPKLCKCQIVAKGQLLQVNINFSINR